jgi:hypothetical protein
MTGATVIEAEQAATLLGRAAAGDEVAFTRIVAAYHPDLRRVAYVVCGDADLADDAAQQAWQIAWRRISTVREPERLRSWLVAVAANEARKLAPGDGPAAERPGGGSSAAPAARSLLDAYAAPASVGSGGRLSTPVRRASASGCGRVHRDLGGRIAP